MSNDLGSRTNFLVGSKTGPSRLKINRVIPSDQGVFRCRIDYNNSPTKNYKVNLTLVEQPSEPIVYDAQGREVFGVAGPFKEGYDLFLSCHVVGGRPRPNVTWWEGDRLLDSVMESATSTLVVNQYFRVNVSRSLYNANLRCKASVLDAAPALVKDVMIEVYLKPQEVNVTLLTEVLTAGRPQQYKCETWGSVPQAKITWLLEDEPVRNAAVTMAHHNNNVTESVLTYRPSSADNGKELTCRAENPRFPGSIMDRKIKLTVLYSPIMSVKRFPGPKFEHLREGGEIRLFCQIDANPEVEEVSWFHGVRNVNVSVTNNGLELLRISLGIYLSREPFPLPPPCLSPKMKTPAKMTIYGKFYRSGRKSGMSPAVDFTSLLTSLGSLPIDGYFTPFPAETIGEWESSAGTDRDAPFRGSQSKFLPLQI
ncbi:UNVERIFIED_CONTAM: hypothetical protein PYX00_007753 [Menopon gallinae]|uniref:Ig-like domain-containing protein n=1 Tax=Menopon gallinae TaxID=328185 RepID=A0AAW2HKY8_9NEOP